MGLIGTIAGVFVLQLLLPQNLSLWIDYKLGLRPYFFLYDLSQGASSWTLMRPLFGHMFVHGNIPHLALNAVWMAVFGAGVARRFRVETAQGVDRFANNILFLTFYLASGLAGAALYIALNPDSMILMVGASGAISGLMGGAMRFALRRDARLGVEAGRLAPVFSRPVMVASITYIGLNLTTLIGRLLSPNGVGLNIAWEAHVGGYLFGLLAFPLFDALVRRPR